MKTNYQVMVNKVPVQLSVHVTAKQVDPVTCIYCNGRGTIDMPWPGDSFAFDICTICGGSGVSSKISVDVAFIEKHLAFLLDRYLVDANMAITRGPLGKGETL
jgi:hypothetical protein